MASTPFPPDDGENHPASELPNGLPLSDVEQLAAQPLNGSAESTAEVPATPPPNDSESNHALEPMAGVRLGDAERIASERLDGAADGSLKEALAIVPPSEPPSAGLPLIDRIEAVAANRAAETEAPSFDVTLAGEASDRQPMPVQAPEPSASVPVEGGGAAWAEEGAAAPSATAAAAAADAGVEAESRDDFHAPAGDNVAATATAPVPAPSPGAHESTRPLASALDAAAKLAADANAAAAALENLKRLLERQLPSIPDSPAPAAAEADAQTSASATAAPTLPPPLPSLPLHAVRDGSGRTTLRPAVLAPPPPRRAQPERIRLDVRGFLAGFALSWAFGVVLYLFMTAG
jgi:hypothetical protein